MLPVLAMTPLAYYLWLHLPRGGSSGAHAVASSQTKPTGYLAEAGARSELRFEILLAVNDETNPTVPFQGV